MLEFTKTQTEVPVLGSKNSTYIDITHRSTLAKNLVHVKAPAIG